MWRECLRLGFAENFHEISISRRICPLSSVGTIFVVVPPPSANVSSQFIIDMEQSRNIQEPGFKTVRHNRAKPRRPVLPSCLGVPVAVIQGSLLEPLLPQLPPLLPARPSSAWGLSHSPSVMPSTVAPSSPIRTPTLRKNVQTTSSLAS